MNSKHVMKMVAVAIGFVLMGCTENKARNDAALEPYRALPVGTYQLALSVNANTSSTPVSGVDFTLLLPKGVNVATAADGSGQILDSALAKGGALPSTSLLVGRFSSAQGQIRLSLTASPKGGWTGEFARLAFTIPAGVAVSENLIQERLAQAGCQVTGLNATQDPVSLGSSVQVVGSLVKH